MADAAQSKNDKCRNQQYFNLDGSASLEKPIDVPVAGAIPAWLKGSLFRNGSGIYKMGDMSWKHTFDGFAVLHRWTIQDGAVSYLAQILDSDHYNRCVKMNRLTGISFGSSFPDPCKNIFSRFFSHFRHAPPADNTSVNIVEFGDRLFALTETSYINEVSRDTLKKTDQTNISSYIAVHMGTAHPHMEKDGTMYYFGTNMKYSQAYNFVRIPANNSAMPSPFAGAQVIGVIPSRWKMNISYTHSFGMTQNYFVHLEQPYVINFPKIATLTLRHSNVADCIRCYPHEPIDIHIISKTTGKRVPIHYKAPFGFVFHFVNCYEDSGFVICDLALYEKSDAIKGLYLSAVCSEAIESLNACFVRYVLPLSLDESKVGVNHVTLAGTHATAVLRQGTKNVLDLTHDKMFGDNLFELPRINYAFNGQKYRYAYGSTIYRRTSPKLMKLDLQERKMYEWKSEETHIIGEPVFVSAPEAKKEDEGVVLCTVLANTTEHSSFLLVLDAATFTEIARATTPADLKMNVTFHGTYVSQG